MTAKPDISARRLALGVLDELKLKKETAQQKLHQKLSRTASPAHATDLVMGVLRHRKTIDRAVTKICGKRIDRISPKLLNILRMGTYELLYCPDTPDYAVINEAVDLAGGFSEKQKGFVNACLRSIQKAIRKRTAVRKKPASDAIPQTPDHACLLHTSVLPDPGQMKKYLSEAYNLPEWLVALWHKHYGDEKTLQICRASRRKPSICIYPNHAHMTLERLADLFDKAGIEYHHPEKTRYFQLKSHQRITELPGYEQGLFFVQDPSAAAVIESLAPETGDTVLDLCAAPGTKTIHLAGLMKDQGTVVATDINPKRLDILRQNASRMNLQAIDVHSYIEFQISQTRHEFDLILVDVPCSNTGVLARRVEAAYRLTKKAFESIEKTQLELLIKAATLASEKTRICYSTCSICPSENEAILDAFLNVRKDYQLTSQTLTLPRADVTDNIDHDGGFFAVLARK